MTPDIATLGLRVDARQVNDADRSLQNFQRSGDRAERSADRLSGTMARMARMAAAVGAALVANEYVRLADAWASMQGKLSLVTNSSRELAGVNERLYSLAQRTRSGLEETAGLYASLTRSTRELGTTESQRLRVAETINKTMAISGTNAQSAAGAIRQLDQAFGSGTLRGDEFNSVLEASPRLIEAIAAGMGRTQGEMRAMAEQGKLTSQAIVQGLLSQSDAIDKEFAKLPTTVGQAMTQVENAVLRAVGVFDQQNKLSSGFASTLSTLAQNMDTVTAAVGTLVAVGLTRWLTSTADRVYAAVTATRAQAAATLAAAQAEATAAAVGAETTAVRLAEARAAQLVATGNVQIALTTNAVIPLQNAHAATVARLDAAMVGLAAAQRGVSLTGGAAAGAMALVGGPVGALVLTLGLAATAWTWYKSKQEEANAKAAEDTEKSTGEIIEQLNKQNTKLRERIELAKQAGMAPAAQAGGEAVDRLAEINALLEAEKKRTAAGKGDALQLINLQAIYNELAGAIGNVTSSTKELAGVQAASGIEGWLEKNSQYLTQSEKLANALKKAKEELKVDVLPADIEKRIRDSFGKKDVKDMQAAIDTAKDYAKNLREQREEIGLTENATILLSASRAAAVAPNKKLADAIMAEARALVVARAEDEEATKAKNAYEEAVKAQAETRLQETLAAQAAVDKAREEVETYGMGAEALTRYNIAKLTATRDTLAFAGAGEKELAHYDNLIAKQQELLVLQGQRDDLDRMFDTAKVESFGDALRNAFGTAGDSLGTLTNALQSYVEKQAAADQARAKARLKYAGDDKKISAEISKINAKEEKDRISAYADMAGAAKGFFKEHTAGYKIMETAERAFRAYELASNAQALFAKLTATTAATTAGVAGNQAVAASATSSAATQVAANQAAGMSSAVAGVANQAKGDPYSAFARMAAMAAIMAALGFAVSGGRGSKPSTASAEYVQKNQGTGSVFGDATAKSATISKSIELLEENSSMLLPLTEGMLAALRSIDAAMNGLTNMVLRTPGVVDGSNMGIQTGKLPGNGMNYAQNTLMGTNGLGGAAAGMLLAGPIGAVLGAVVGPILGKLWGSVKQDITDSGIQFGGRVSDLQAGQGFNQYANVHTTKKSWFGLSKKESDSLQTGALDAGLTQQFALVFKNLETMLRSTATGLGMDADKIGAAVQGATIDTTKLSLKGLKGQELQDAVNAVLSKAVDDVAASALPGFDEFRKLGEGYAETVIRVATGIEQAGLELEQLGVTAIAYADIANKQGDVGAEIVRQSIAAREGMSGVGEIMRTLGGTAQELADTYRELQATQERMRMVGMDPAKLDRGLIRQAGSLDALQDGLDNYFDSFFTESERLAAKTAAMSEKFAALGVTMPTTTAGFRELVETTPALTGRLLLLAEGFAELMEASDEKAAAALELTNSRRSLEAQIMRLQGDEAGALAIERGLELAGMDASLRPLQERVWALEDEAAALDKAKAAADKAKADGDKARADAMNDLRRAVDAERAVKQKAYEETVKAIDLAMSESRKKISSLQALSQTLNSGREQVGVEDTDRAGAQARIAAQLAIAKAGGAMAVNAEEVKKALAVLAKDSSDAFGSSREYLADRYQTAIAVGELASITDEALSFEEQNLSKLEALRKTADEQFAAEMKYYDRVLEQAQRTIDAINGVDTSTKSVAAALAALDKLTQPGTNGIPATATNGSPAAGTQAQDAIEKLYGSILGRASDADGKQFWLDRLAGGVSLSSIEEAFRNSDEARSGGWMAGSMSKSSASIAPVAAENRELINEVKNMKSELVDALGVVASYTQRTATTNEDMNRRELEKEDQA